MKRFKGVFLTGILTVTALAGTFAAAVSKSSTISVHAESHSNHDGITFNQWTSASSLPTSGDYYLDTDVTLSSTASVSGTLRLCLNGHFVKMTGTGDAISVNSTTFSLYECDYSTTHKYSTDDEGLATVNDALATDYGTFLGGYVTSLGKGRGIVINGSSTVHVYGGTIIGNKSSAGAGIHAPYQKGISKNIYVYGGNIVGNVATAEYGGIMAAANCKLYLRGTAMIYNNRTTNSSAAGIYGGGPGTYVQGDVKIFNNINGNGDHMDLRANGGQSQFYCDGLLGSGAEIHIYNNGLKNNLVQNYYSYNSEDPSKYFKPDVGVFSWSKDSNNAKYTQKYIVTYETNGGSAVSSTSEGVNALPDPLPTPTKEGYKLEGWYKESTFTTKANAGELLGNDITLYAKWTVNDNVSDVISKIESIGTVTYPDSKDAISAARTAYDALSTVEKSLVENYSTLTDAEARYAELVAAKAAADAVITKINEIGEVTYPDSKSKIDAARSAYDALDEDGKSFVTNLSTLTDAESTYFSLRDGAVNNVKDLINAIGTLEYTDTCKGKVSDARTAYDALTQEQKALVDNYATLTHAEDVLAHVDTAVEKIEAIGEVTLDSKDKIEAAKDAYESLTGEEKNLIPDYYDTLVEKENIYIELVGSKKPDTTLAIVFGIIGGVILLIAIIYVLMMFVFNKWIKKEDKAVRAFKLGKKDNKVRLLVMPFKFEYRDETEVFNKKEDALK